MSLSCGVRCRRHGERRVRAQIVYEVCIHYSGTQQKAHTQQTPHANQQNRGWGGCNVNDASLYTPHATACTSSSGSTRLKLCSAQCGIRFVRFARARQQQRHISSRACSCIIALEVQSESSTQIVGHVWLSRWTLWLRLTAKLSLRPAEARSHPTC